MLKVTEIVDSEDGWTPEIVGTIIFAGEDISEAGRALTEYLIRATSPAYAMPVLEWWYTTARNGDKLYVDNGGTADEWSWNAN